MDKSLVRFMAGICCMILMVAGGGMMRPQPVYATPFAFATVNDVYRQDFNTLAPQIGEMMMNQIQPSQVGIQLRVAMPQVLAIA